MRKAIVTLVLLLGVSRWVEGYDYTNSPQKRPFSFYYPNSYQYYYPRAAYHACVWLRTSEGYICKSKE